MTQPSTNVPNIAAPVVRRPTAGARESNAGDAFHVLWAARRALHLIEPRTTLKLVVMEGVTPTDGVVGDNDDLFLGVDVSEYYEGTDFGSATGVIASQLKYSTRNPDRPWTAGRLRAANRSGRRQSGASVVRRLADVYSGFRKQASRADVIRKLKVQLVSNQPVGDELAEALEAAQQYLQLAGIQDPIPTATCLKHMPGSGAALLRGLQAASGLSSIDFTDFLRVLRLGHTPEVSRAFQRLRLIQELSSVVSNNPVANLRSLCELIGSEATPERVNSLGLRAEDILAALEVGDADDLFPAPSALTPLPVDVIETADAAALAHTIEGANGGRVLAFGDAGIGKTTTVQMIGRYLPAGSVVVIFDCFGGGSYLVPGEQRHTDKRAFLQLTNELALHCGTPFLLRPAQDQADLVRGFRKSLDAAAKIVAGAPGALLVLVIDAADNAQIAGRRFGDQTFIESLWEIEVPANCRVVMTSRSHRRTSLNPPSDAVQHELCGFDKSASSSYLRLRFSDADTEMCDAFHAATGGTPRLEAYVLDQIATAPNPISRLEDLRSSGSISLSGIFDDLWEAAVIYAQDPGQAQQHLATLLSLARPVLIRVFGTVTGLGANAEDFCRALTPGLVLGGDTVAFRDEDFESYLREKLSAEDLRAAHDRLGTFFLASAERDAYAARHVADHLFTADRFNETIELGLQGEPPALVIADNLLRVEVARRRLRLALQAAGPLGRDEAVVRLLLLAAEAAQSDHALTALVRANPELAAVYGDTESVSRLYMREENNAWLGSAHLRTAAMLARDPSTRNRAADHMNAAEAWIRRFMALPEYERYGWQLDGVDVGRGAEAVFWLAGSSAAAQWLRRWRPPGIVIHAAEHFGRSLGRQLTDDQVAAELRPMRLRPEALAAILAGLWQSGRIVPREFVHSAANALNVRIDRGRVERDTDGSEQLGWAVIFSELAASVGVEPAAIISILHVYGPAFPSYIPQERVDLAQFDLPLRSRCLEGLLTDQEVTADILLPERYRPKEERSSNDQYHHERRRFQETIGEILPVYIARARAIVYTLDVSEIVSYIENGLSARRENAEHRWFRGDPSYQLWAVRVNELLIRCAGDAEKLVQAISDLAEGAVRHAAPGVWLAVAGVLIPHELRRQMAYEAVARAADYVTNNAYPGAERWQVLLRCANLVAPFDHDLGREYYERGLLAAEGLDDDSALLIKFQAHVAHIAPLVGSVDERREIAARLVRLVEAQEPYVSQTSALPREQVLESVTFLDPPDGFALCSRWDDENRLTLDDSIPRVIRVALAVGFLSRTHALPLFRLAGERFDISEDAVRILESLYEHGPAARPSLLQALRTVSSWIVRDVPLLSRQRAAARVVAWADGRGLAGLAGVADLRRIAEFPVGIGTAQQSQTRLRDDPEREQAIQSLLAHASHASLAEVEPDLRAIWGKSFDPEPILTYVDRLRRATAPAQQLAMLDTLSALGADEMLGSAIARALAMLLVHFRNSPPVREWAPHAITEFLDAALPALVSEYRDRGEIEALLESPPLVNEPSARLLLPGIIRHLTDLGPPDLYRLARLIARRLATTDVAEVLRWSMGRLEGKIRADGRALPALELTPMPQTTDGVIARFLWALCGHPDKLVRWRALHSARELLLAGGTQVLSELAQLSRTRSCVPFGSSSREFYWLSARVWVLILLLRVAYEQPASIREHLGVLVEHALDPTLPHAQIRELARRSALRVVAEFGGVLPPDTVSALERANQPRACLYPSDMPYNRQPRRDRRRSPRDESRFSFWIDTENYWFAALDRVFGYPDVDVQDRAERWIVDTWGRTNEDWWHDPRELSGRYESRELYASRESVPTIETLRVYLEYHSMCCAAGEMIDSLPIAVDTYDGGLTDHWKEWLAEQLPWRDSHWISDLRSATPLRSDCWGQLGDVDEWLRTITESEYDEALGMAEYGHVGQLVVLGHHEVGDDRRRGTVRVSSALVSPPTAGALMCALQTTEPNDFLLPLDGIWRDDAIITEPEFELTPWLTEGRSDEGLDGYDPLGRIEVSSLSSFGDDFLSTIGATASGDGLQFWNPGGKQVGSLEVWNDRLEKERATEFYTAGERLWVELDILLEYLRTRDRDLIIEVTIARNRSERSYRQESEKYDLGRDRIYLLRGDGTLETLAGRRAIGGSARTRVGLF